MNNIKIDNIVIIINNTHCYTTIISYFDIKLKKI